MKNISHQARDKVCVKIEREGLRVKWKKGRKRLGGKKKKERKRIFTTKKYPEYKVEHLSKIDIFLSLENNFFLRNLIKKRNNRLTFNI